MKVKCLAQEHNTMSPARQPGLEPGALALESNTLTMRSPRQGGMEMSQQNLTVNHLQKIERMGTVKRVWNMQSGRPSDIMRWCDFTQLASKLHNVNKSLFHTKLEISGMLLQGDF